MEYSYPPTETSSQTFPPWKDAAQWRQIEIFFRHTWNTAMVAPEVEELSRAIEADMGRVDVLFDDLCSATCPSCLVVCCRRATVWYDLRDLIFYYTLHQELPVAQILRETGGDCAHLSRNGCRLERLRRPFVCTWYLCSQQKVLVERQKNSAGEESLTTIIERMKWTRRLLEQAFLHGVCGDNLLSS